LLVETPTSCLDRETAYGAALRSRADDAFRDGVSKGGFKKSTDPDRVPARRGNDI
jgi:hypothetical protein